MLGALAALAGIIAQSQAQASQQEIERENLAFQKSQARRSDQLTTAPRTDVYGNRAWFDDALKEWMSKLAPTQEKLVKAGEHEQLLSLTEDASRDRALKERQAQRSQQAGEDFQRAETGYRFDQPPSEDAIRNDLIGEITNAKIGNANKTKQFVGQQALRLGRGGDLSKITSAVNRDLGDSVGDTVLESRGRAMSESAQREGQHNNKYLPALDQFAKLMDRINPSSLRFSDAPGEMDQKQREMLNAILGSIGAGADKIGGAYGRVATAAGQSPDFGSLASALASIKMPSFGGGGATGATRSSSNVGPSAGNAMATPPSGYMWSPGGTDMWVNGSVPSFYENDRNAAPEYTTGGFNF